MPSLASQGPLAVPAALLALSLALALAGCGGSTPSSFDEGEPAKVPAEMAAFIADWAQAQRTLDEDALAALMAAGYAYNGVTAEHAHDLLLAPHNDQTRVSTLTYELLAVEEDTLDHDEVAAQAYHTDSVTVRLRLSGVTSAEVIEKLASEEEEEEDEHTHTHAAAATGSFATVPFNATCDVVLTIGHDDALLDLAAQRIQVASFRYGDGMSAAVLDEVHAHPDSVAPGGEVEAHGALALLPPGGVVSASIGESDPVTAEVAAGSFHCHLTAPPDEGTCLVRVEAYGGNVEAQTASITIAEREVQVTDGDA